MALFNPFPSWFPSPQQDSYAIEAQSMNVRQEMDSGEIDQIQVRSLPRDVIPVVWILRGDKGFTGDDVLALFETIFKRALKNGNVWHLQTLRDGMGKRELECRFVTPAGSQAYSIKPKGNIWYVTAQLEVREREAQTQEWLDLVYLQDQFLPLVENSQAVLDVLSLPMHPQYSHLFNFDPIYPMINGIQVHDKGH